MRCLILGLNVAFGGLLAWAGHIPRSGDVGHLVGTLVPWSACVGTLVTLGLPAGVTRRIAAAMAGALQIAVAVVASSVLVEGWRERQQGDIVVAVSWILPLVAFGAPVASSLWLFLEVAFHEWTFTGPARAPRRPPCAAGRRRRR